jgi:hypothetical protein
MGQSQAVQFCGNGFLGPISGRLARDNHGPEYHDLGNLRVACSVRDHYKTNCSAFCTANEWTGTFHRISKDLPLASFAA